jgi:hypothetical protein
MWLEIVVVVDTRNKLPQCRDGSLDTKVENIGK